MPTRSYLVRSAMRYVATPVIVLVALAFVAGCGQSTQTAGGPGSGGAPAKNCGSVSFQGNNPPIGSTAAQSENCFYTSFQNCTSATLTTTSFGVDTGTTRVFTTASNNGGCTITDSVSSYVVPRPTPTPKSYTCSGLKQQSDGLHFSSCGADGDVFIPAPKS